MHRSRYDSGVRSIVVFREASAVVLPPNASAVCRGTEGISMKRVGVMVILLMSLIGWGEVAQAQEDGGRKLVDVYVSGFGGYAFPFNTEFTSRTSTTSEVDLKSGPSLGGKIGVWIMDTRQALGVDVGVELDVTDYHPDTQGALELHATYVGLNVLARMPMRVTEDRPNGHWFPYVGFGGGGQRLSMQISGTDQGRDTVIAFQGLGGVKLFVTRHVAVFAEGKFIHASHQLGVEGTFSFAEFDVNSVHGTGGLSVHF